MMLFLWLLIIAGVTIAVANYWLDARRVDELNLTELEQLQSYYEQNHRVDFWALLGEKDSAIRKMHQDVDLGVKKKLKTWDSKFMKASDCYPEEFVSGNEGERSYTQYSTIANGAGR